MPPYNKERFLKIDVNQAALPFNAPVYEKTGGQEQIENDGNQQTTPNSIQAEIESSSNDNSNLRITTRARHTYELDRFNKNAMLIIDNKSHMHREHLTHNLDETFEKFSFEVEKYYNLTQAEIISTCKSFFQRDFTEYGAVAVAVLGQVHREFPASGSSFNESIVLRNLTLNLPTTLRGKPIIYITEVADCYTSTGDAMDYPEILIFHIPFSLVAASHPAYQYYSTFRPLQILSQNLNETGDVKSLLDVMVSTLDDIMKTWTSFYQDYPIRIVSTLRKELVLVKS